MGDSRTSKDPQAQLRRACAEMDRGLRAGEDAAAEQLLARFPELASCDELALELIYNEFVVREELGQSPSIDDWYRRFPRHRDHLERLFHVDELLRDPPPGRSTNNGPQTTNGSAAGEAPRPIGRLGRYELIEEVGRGGMGVVYKARQPGVERLVAVKMLRGPEAGSAELARLLNEARLVGQMRHPNIVQIYEVGEHDGQPFLALEYADGGSLDRWLAGKPLPAREAAEMARDLCRAVQHAHDAGIVHRDLKPANVLLTMPAVREGAVSKDRAADLRSYAASLPGGVVKITDFGLARQLSDPGAHTRSGQALGTACYMAPEQAEGRPGWAAPACDIYGLGAILYELLTGRPPHLGESVVQTLQLVVHADPVSPRLLRPGVPRDLETICLKCLEKEPHRRYVSAADLADDLNLFLDRLPVRARPLSAPARLWRQARRRPAVAGLVGVIAASLVALVVGWAHFTRQLGRQRDLALWNESQAVEEKREADVQRERAVKGEGDARRELDRAGRMLFAATLLRARQLGEADPARAAVLLDDEALCPPARRDFAWGALRHHLRRKGQVLRDLPARVLGVAWSPDGFRLVAASSQGDVVVWDAAARRPVRRLQGPPVTRCFAVGPGGAVAVGGEGPILVWTAEGQQRCRLGPAGQVVREVVFLDGDTLASVGDGGLLLWGLPRGEVRAKLDIDPAKVKALAAVGGLLATAGTDPIIRLWDPRTSAVRPPLLKGHRASVFCLAASPDGRTLISGDSGGRVLLWDAARGTSRLLASTESPVIYSVAITSDRRRVAWSHGSGAAYLFDVARNALLESLGGHPSAVHGLAFSPDGRLLATGSGGLVGSPLAGEVRLYEPGAGAGRVLGQGPASGEALHFAGSDMLLASGGVVDSPQASHHGVRRIRTSDGKELPPLLPPGPGFLRCVAGPNGRAWVGGQDGVLRRWDLAGEKVEAELPQGGAVRGLALSPDGRSLAVAATGRTVRVLSPQDGRPTHDTAVAADRVMALQFSGDGSWLAFFTRGRAVNSLHRFDLASGRLLPPLELEAHGYCWLRDHRTLAVGYRGGQVRLLDAVSGAEKASLSGHTDMVWALAVSPAGDLLASGGRDGTVRLWDLATGQELLTLRGHTGSVFALRFSPDGRSLVSSSFKGSGRGGEILLWERE